jgi:cytochrome c
MKKIFVSMMVVVFMVATIGLAFASSEADEAKGLVEKAAVYYQANGKEKALKEFNTPGNQFVKGELYVFVYDMTGTMVAHPINKKLVGMNLLNTPDVDGKLFRKEIIELAKKSGSGWVDYKYKNPQSNKIEQKTTYLKKAEDTVICCGAYK